MKKYRRGVLQPPFIFNIQDSRFKNSMIQKFKDSRFKIKTSPYTPSGGGQYAPIPLWRGQGEVIEFNYSIIQLFSY